jgi:hypothetical protein
MRPGISSLYWPGQTRGQPIYPMFGRGQTQCKWPKSQVRTRSAHVGAGNSRNSVPRWLVSSAGSKDRKLKPLPPDPFRHQDSTSRRYPTSSPNSPEFAGSAYAAGELWRLTQNAPPHDAPPVALSDALSHATAMRRLLHPVGNPSRPRYRARVGSHCPMPPSAPQCAHEAGRAFRRYHRGAFRGSLTRVCAAIPRSVSTWPAARMIWCTSRSGGPRGVGRPHALAHRRGAVGDRIQRPA